MKHPSIIGSELPFLEPIETEAFFLSGSNNNQSDVINKNALVGANSYYNII